MNKLTSGRFIFTVITAVVFLYATINEMLSQEQIMSIIVLIATFYFNKERTSK